MPAIYGIRLTDALVLAGPAYEQVQGYGDDKFTCGRVGDVGAFLSGIDGDTVHILRKQNGWMISWTFLTAAGGIGLLERLHSTLGVFPIKVSYGQWNLVGVCNMLNMGEVAASLGNTARTMTAGISKISGNTDVSPGYVIQVL